MKANLLRCSMLFLLFFMLALVGRASAADWAASFGGLAGGAGAAVTVQSTVTDSAGNTYLSGHFNGGTYTIGNITLAKIGSQDAFVAKIDPSGTPLWAKNFGGPGATTLGTGVAVDASGNVYLGGSFSVANLTTPALTVIGNNDSFAIKLDSSGTTTWGKNFGGIGAGALAKSIAVDGSGNVYLAGYINNANLTTPALTKIGTVDAFAIKLDSSGATTWAKNFGGSGAGAVANAIAVDDSGNIYLGGYFYTTNITTPALTKIGIEDGFAIKLDSSGASIWAKNFGGVGDTTTVNGIAVDASGSVYLAGSFSATNNLTTPPLAKLGSTAAMAIKLDSSGTTTWAQRFGGTGVPDAYGIRIAVDASGNVYLGGYFQTASLTYPALTKIGTVDAFAIKLNSSGVTTWARNFGGTGSSTSVYGYGIGVDATGNVYLGGYFTNSLTTPALTKIGGQDAFVIKLDSSGATTWATNSYSRTPEIFAIATTTDAAGNSYLTGYFNQTSVIIGGVPLTKIGVYDTFVAKFDRSGTVLWAKNFGGSGATAYSNAIAVDVSGNVYLGGNFTGASLTTPALTKIGGTDAFAIKLDSSGGTTWAKNFGGSTASVTVRGIAVAGSGNVYLGGSFGTANLTTPALTKIGSTDTYAIKLDSSGGIIWGKNFGGSGANAFSYIIAVDSSGNVYLGGYLSGASLTTPALTKIGSQDAFAIKLDSSGVITWAKNFGGSGANANGYGIAVDGSGNVYLGGYFNNTLTTPALTKIGNSDAFAIKLDNSGATTWAKNFGGIGAGALAKSIAVDGSGNVYLAGYINNANLTTPALTKIGAVDAFAIKLDSSGVTTWAKNFGGSGANAVANAIAVDDSGNIYLGGYYSSANLSTPAMTKIGSTDAFIISILPVAASATAPTATTGAASSITATTATLGGTASSNGAATTVTFDYGTTASYGSSTTASQSPLAAGTSGSAVSAALTGLTCNTTYHFRVVGVNSAGTSNGSDATFTTSVCSQTITFAALPATSLGSAPLTLSATASSGLAVTFTSSDSSVASVSGTTLTLRKAGTTYITASQGGNATWLAAPNVIRTLTVTSFGKPALTVSTLANGSVTRVNTLNISGTADSVNGGTAVTINGVAVALESDNSFSSPYPLVPGSNNITTVATDSASQSASDSRTITLNLSAPELAVTAPVDNSSTASSLLTVTGSVTDANATVKVALNNGTAQSASRNGLNFSSDLILSEGQNTIQVTATDLAQATSSVARTVTYNRQGPTLTITSPAADLTTDQASVTLTGAIADALSDVTVTITCDGHTYTKTVAAPGGAFSQTLAAFATAGSYSISVTAVDTNGNQAASRRNVIYQPAPVVTVTSTPVGRTVVVDGVAVVTPQSYSWSTGSSHTIAVLTTTQTGVISGTRYQFGSWSDAGAASHTITVPATSATYTASFATQHQLTTSAGTGGTVQPTTGNWYTAGTNATIIATPTTGYAFNNCSLTGTGPLLSSTGSATTVTMNGPNSVAANFKSISTTLTASLSGSKSGTLGGSRSWPITLTNTGGAPATSAQITSMAVSTSGTCKPVVTTPFPLSIGSINTGSSSTGSVTIDFSSCSAAKQIALKFNATINYSASGGVTTGTTSLTSVTQ